GDDQHDQRQQEREQRRVPAPARAARGDRREHRGRREGGRGAAPVALLAHVEHDRHGDEDERREDERGAEAHRERSRRRSPEATVEQWRAVIASAPAGGRRTLRSSNDALSRALVRSLAELDVERDGLAVALDLDRDDVARRLTADRGGDVGRVVDAAAVDADDDVADLDAGAGGGPTRAHGADDGAVLLRRRGPAGDRAEVRTLDRLALLQARDDLADGVGRDGEADADVAVAR